MPVFDDDFAAVDAMLAEVFGGTVSIHRGTLETTGVTAEATSRDHDVEDIDGLVTIANVRDYVIDVADYTFSDDIVTPRNGDKIKETIGETTHVFEVLPLANRPSVEWLGNQKPQWLIHTKLIGTE